MDGSLTELSSGNILPNVNIGGAPSTYTLVYNKHHYIGSERISAKIRTQGNFDAYTPTSLHSKMNALTNVTSNAVRIPSKNTLIDANSTVIIIHSTCGGMTLTPAQASTSKLNEGDISYLSNVAGAAAGMLNLYYFHPDHLGSSIHMTKESVVVC